MRILFAGLGGAGQRWLRLFRSLRPEAELLAFRARGKPGVITPDFKYEGSRSLEKIYGLKTFPTLEAALEQGPDFAVVANPTGLHMSVALPLARAGCPFFLEKPLSHEWEGVEELLEISSQKDLCARVGYQTRLHPCLLWIREELRRQAFGRVLGVRVKTSSYLPDWHAYEDYRTLYAARKDLGGGVLLTESHEMDYLTWLFGIPDSVYALAASSNQRPLEVEDTVSVLLEYKKSSGNFSVHLDLSFLSRPPFRSLEISVEGGRLVWDTERWDTVRFFETEANKWQEKTFPGWDRNRLFEEAASQFLLCLGGKDVPLPSLQEAAQGLQLILAAKRSISTGRAVEVGRVLEEIPS